MVTWDKCCTTYERTMDHCMSMCHIVSSFFNKFMIKH
uniref:Uncharacterized protein n=1 Tax=Anguilla anguilla TaxID=7936 RepID=A0A0E9QIC7_ANGAN